MNDCEKLEIMSELKLRNSKKTPPLEGTSQGLNDDGLHQIKGKNLWINGKIIEIICVPFLPYVCGGFHFIVKY